MFKGAEVSGTTVGAAVDGVTIGGDTLTGLGGIACAVIATGEAVSFGIGPGTGTLLTGIAGALLLEEKRKTNFDIDCLPLT